MRLFFFGGFGSDAGGWYIGADGKIHKVPGWNPEQVVELARLVSVLAQETHEETSPTGRPTLTT
ncbi:MAG TPA: hypothetical protein VIM30_07485 [Candidatus Limnocylindrales bacterium]|jgi:hypothetical protein